MTESGGMATAVGVTAKPSLVLYLSVGVALLGAISMGTTMGWSSPALPDMDRNGSLPQVSDPSTKSTIGSAVNIGGIVGGLIGGPLANLLGRRLGITLVAVPFLAAWMPIIFASSVTPLIVGRILTGLSAAVASSMVPMYICEVSTPAIRGLLGSSFQLFISIGLLIDSLAGIGLDWQWISVVAALPLIPLVILMPFMPPSPVHMVNVGRLDAARQALSRLRSRDSDVTGELDQLIQSVPEKSNSNEEGQKFSLTRSVSETWAKVRRPDGWKPLSLAVTITVLQQLTGVTGIVFFQKDIFTSASRNLDVNMATALVFTIQVIATGVAALIVDRAGRRLLLGISSTIHIISLTVLGGFYYQKSIDPPFADTYSWIPVVCLVSFFIGYSIGFGPIPWCMISELSPNFCRGLVSSVAVTANWLAGFLISRYFTSLESALGSYGTFWGFAGCCLIALGFVVFILPETRGKSLAEIQEIYLMGSDDVNGVDLKSGSIHSKEVIIC